MRLLHTIVKKLNVKINHNISSVSNIPTYLYIFQNGKKILGLVKGGSQIISLASHSQAYYVILRKGLIEF